MNVFAGDTRRRVIHRSGSADATQARFDGVGVVFQSAHLHDTGVFAISRTGAGSDRHYFGMGELQLAIELARLSGDHHNPRRNAAACSANRHTALYDEEHQRPAAPRHAGNREIPVIHHGLEPVAPPNVIGTTRMLRTDAENAILSPIRASRSAAGAPDRRHGTDSRSTHRPPSRRQAFERADTPLVRHDRRHGGVQRDAHTSLLWCAGGTASHCPLRPAGYKEAPELAALPGSSRINRNFVPAMSPQPQR